jgi:hypothetical protein
MTLYSVLALVPLLLLLLHPAIFHRALGAILRGLRLPAQSLRVSGARLIRMLGWMLAGLLVQIVAIWILLGQPNTFDISARHLPLVAAAYSLAWCVGTLVIWVPAGIGILELVFIKVLLLAPLGFLGAAFTDSLGYKAMLALMSILLRIWSTCGDLLLAATALAIEIVNPPPGLPGVDREPVQQEQHAEPRHISPQQP